ncbi:MAG TPA: acetyl-CoA carboxylase biotin carboxyl carrier protein [Tepidisphaeraceae bacterium]|nr:acetyl-CoA carboxylase biotin carboxyl carrier protein [Tepidisphaeraceae bacterium]
MSEKRTGKKKRSAGDPPPATPAGNGGPMDVGLLEKIVRLMSANDLNTVDVRDGDRRVILKRGAVEAPRMTYLAPPMSAAPAPAAAVNAGGGEGASADAGDDAGLLPIKSPMVGTFYAAPSKGAKPFVTAGSAVEEETDVCIVEAMKVFNNIKAECRGTVARILVSDGQSVEFGTVMFLVKPA